MTTIGKRSSPKKDKNFKKTYSLNKHHSPKKNAKVAKAVDHVTFLREAKKVDGSTLKAKQLNKSSGLSPQLKRHLDLNPFKAKKTYNASVKAPFKIPKHGSSSHNNGSPKSRAHESLPSVPVSSGKPREEVPSLEFCAEFGFRGKKAEVARNLIGIQKGFSRLTTERISTTYADKEFMEVFRETSIMGVKVAGGDFEIWMQLSRKIFELLQMRLTNYGFSQGQLLESVGSYDIAEWAEKWHAVGYSNTLLPENGPDRELLDLAVSLHQQIDAVKEFDREDGVM